MTLRFDPERGAWLFDVDGQERELKNPDGPPSGRQLLLLAHRGLLAIRTTPGAPLTKLDAAKAIDRNEGERNGPLVTWA